MLIIFNILGHKISNRFYDDNCKWYDDKEDKLYSTKKAITLDELNNIHDPNINTKYNEKLNLGSFSERQKSYTKKKSQKQYDIKKGTENFSFQPKLCDMPIKKSLTRSTVKTKKSDSFLKQSYTMDYFSNSVNQIKQNISKWNNDEENWFTGSPENIQVSEFAPRKYIDESHFNNDHEEVIQSNILSPPDNDLSENQEKSQRSIKKSQKSIKINIKPQSTKGSHKRIMNDLLTSPWKDKSGNTSRSQIDIKSTYQKSERSVSRKKSNRNLPKKQSDRNILNLENLMIVPEEKKQEIEKLIDNNQPTEYVAKNYTIERNELNIENKSNSFIANKSNRSIAHKSNRSIRDKSARSIADKKQIEERNKYQKKRYQNDYEPILRPDVKPIKTGKPSDVTKLVEPISDIKDYIKKLKKGNSNIDHLTTTKSREKIQPRTYKRMDVATTKTIEKPQPNPRKTDPSPVRAVYRNDRNLNVKSTVLSNQPNKDHSHNKDLKKNEVTNETYATRTINKGSVMEDRLRNRNKGIKNEFSSSMQESESFYINNLEMSNAFGNGENLQFSESINEPKFAQNNFVNKPLNGLVTYQSSNISSNNGEKACLKKSSDIKGKFTNNQSHINKRIPNNKYKNM